MTALAINSGDTSWVLFCTAAVLFMTPGLGLFYAGMVSRRNTLVMLQQNFIPLGVISLTWVMWATAWRSAPTREAGSSPISSWSDSAT